MLKRIRRRRRIRRVQTRYINRMQPEGCAQLLRNIMRADIGDRETRLALARRAQLSTNPGEAASMQKYEAAILAGRTVKYGTFPVRFIEPVDRELTQAVEDVFKETNDGSTN